MAVYTEVTDEDLVAFLIGYGLGEVVSCKGIAEGVENTNYLLRTTEGFFILTLYEKRVHPEDLPFFLNLMQHLESRGIPCPQPIVNRVGLSLGRLCGRPAALTSFLEGMWPRRIQPFHCEELGSALARLHMAGADFDQTRKNNLSIESWRPLFEQCQDHADTVRPGLPAMIERELSFLEANWPTDLPSGVCHADLFPDNVFFRGEKLSGLIDFYFACNDFYIYDLVVCMNAWCFERDGSFNVTKARLLLKAYIKVRPLNEAEIKAVPILARGAAIRFLLTRLFDWLNHPEGAFVKPKDPLEYATILNFHQGVEGIGAYGLTEGDILTNGSNTAP